MSDEPFMPPEWQNALRITDYVWQLSLGTYHNKTLRRGMLPERILREFTPEQWIKFHESSMDEYNKDPQKYNTQSSAMILGNNLVKPACWILPLWVLLGWSLVDWKYWLIGILACVIYLWVAMSVCRWLIRRAEKKVPIEIKWRKNTGMWIFGFLLFWFVSMIGAGILARIGESKNTESSWVVIVMLFLLVTLLQRINRNGTLGKKSVGFSAVGYFKAFLAFPLFSL